MKWMTVTIIILAVVNIIITAIFGSNLPNAICGWLVVITSQLVILRNIKKIGAKK